MKKFLAMLLALVMLFSLAACSAKEDQEEENNKETVTETATEKEDVSLSVPRGKVDNVTYTSEYSGLSITLDSDSWSFTDDESLAKEMGVSVDAITNNLSNAFASCDSVIDVQASDSSLGSSFEISYKSNQSAAQYFASIKSGLNSLSGVEYSVVEESTVTLCGQEYNKMILDAEAVGTSTTRCYYSRVNEDNLLICVEFIIFDSVEASEVEAMFNA